MTASRHSYSRLVSLLLASLLLIVLCGPAMAQKDNAGAKADPPKAAVPLKGRLPAHFRTVVTDEQRQKIYAVQQEYDPRIRKLREQLKTLTAERNAKIDALLTPEQRKKIADLKAAAKEKRKQARKAKAADKP
ncbi:MAG TPA: hypothetical protein VJL29_15695 [Thermoguttaceae bacterium]|nr:hypothetical protein [Thermoguttaceae bacterium]